MDGVFSVMLGWQSMREEEDDDEEEEVIWLV